MAQIEGSSAGARVGTAVRGVLGLVGSAIRLITGAFATVLVLHILLTVLGANPLNGVTRLVAAVADSLTLGLRDLFVLDGPVLQVIASYGVPAVAWLVIGSILVAVLRAIARPRSGLR